MLVFASPVPSAFPGFGALQPRHLEQPSAEEQYFQKLAEEHERAATLARKRMLEARRRQEQQRELEAQLRLRQELATALQSRAPQCSPFNTPTRSLGRSPFAPGAAFGFDLGDNDASDLYAERIRLQIQRNQKQLEQQARLRAMLQEQRRAQAERVAELHRQRVQQAKAEQERQRKAQEEQEARRRLASRAADEEKLRQFFQVLVGAMSESQGADLERKNAIRRNSVPAQEKPQETPAPAPKSAATSPAPKRAPSPARSTASDASDVSLTSIALLQDKFDTLRSNFSLPTSLAFSPSSSSSNPGLSYNPTNAPVHAYEHALTGLLTDLDAVESFGDSHVRDVRRSLARNVEAELEALDAKKREMWKAQNPSVDATASESTPAPIEVTVVPVEVVPAAEAVPVESTVPVAEAAAIESAAPELEPTSTESSNPVEWLTTQLSQATESEDEELKAVREGLLAQLAEPTSVPTEATTATEAELTAGATAQSVIESQADAAETSSATESEPLATEVEPATESEPAVESPDSDLASSPVESFAEAEVIEAHTSMTPIPASEPEAELVDSSSESVPEPEIIQTASSAPEAEAKASAPSPIQPEHEHSTFVQVFPDSESDNGTDADLASELADRKSNGDEFELL